MTASAQTLHASPDADRPGQPDAWRHVGPVTVGLLALPILLASGGIRPFFVGLSWFAHTPPPSRT